MTHIDFRHGGEMICARGNAITPERVSQDFEAHVYRRGVFLRGTYVPGSRILCRRRRRKSGFTSPPAFWHLRTHSQAEAYSPLS